MHHGGLKATLRSWVQGSDDAPRTDADRAARLLREAEAHGPTWFWQTDRLGRVSYLSDKIAAVFVQAGIDPVGMSLTDLLRIAGGDVRAADAERTIAFHLSARTAFADYAVTPAIPSHDERGWTVSGSPFADPYGRFEGFVGTGTDIAAIRRTDAAITRLALFDSLTGLANRQRMRLSLEQTLAQGGYDGTALFLLDLDRFKAVNDTLGHPVGDALLKQVATRLTDAVGDAGLVGRLGGDEFQVVLPRMGERARMAALAQAIIAALSQPYFLGGTSVSIGCSIGIAVSPDDGGDPDALVADADLALYAAKGAGRGVHRFFHDALLDDARSRHRLENDLRHALALDQLRLVYQPVVTAADGTITGFEALLRWDHPVRGRLLPADFLAVAEECGLIAPIGEWVLRTACRDAATWGGETHLAVNLADAQFANPALPAIVTNALARAGLAPDRLELDITEASVLRDLSAAATILAPLKAVGVRIALNDFGAGPASLAALRRLPFDRIKSGRSFPPAGGPDGRDAAMMRAITAMAAAMAIDTTAKGIEYHDEIDAVRTLGCDAVQGFVHGRPVAADDAAALLRAPGGVAAATGPKSPRAPRTRMLRSTVIDIDGTRTTARIRDLSSTGALIDSVGFGEERVGQSLRIEIADDHWAAAVLRWVQDGRAGLHFVEPIVVDRRVMRRRGGLRGG